MFFKLENLYGVLFKTKCTMKYRERANDILSGSKPQTLYNKISIGFVLFVALVFVLVAPIILFSSINPVSIDNNVRAVSLECSLRFVGGSGELPESEFDLYQSKSSMVPPVVSGAEFAQLERDTGKTVVTPDFQPLSQNVLLPSYSSSEWLETLSGRVNLLHLLQAAANVSNPLNATIALDFIFTRPGPSTYKEVTYHGQIPLSPMQAGKLCRDIARTVNLSTVSCGNATLQGDIILEHAIPSVLGLGGSVLEAENVSTSESDKVLKLRLCNAVYGDCVQARNAIAQQGGRSLYWQLHDYDRASGASTKRGPTLFIVSQKIVNSSFLFGSSYGIVGFYVGIVYTIGQLVRTLFSSPGYRIPIDEMYDTTDLLELCEGLYICRSEGRLRDEIRLFYTLMSIYRSTERMLRLTRKSRT